MNRCFTCNSEQDKALISRTFAALDDIWNQSVFLIRGSYPAWQGSGRSYNDPIVGFLVALTTRKLACSRAIQLEWVLAHPDRYHLWVLCVAAFMRLAYLWLNGQPCKSLRAAPYTCWNANLPQRCQCQFSLLNDGLEVSPGKLHDLTLTFFSHWLSVLCAARTRLILTIICGKATQKQSLPITDIITTPLISPQALGRHSSLL